MFPRVGQRALYLPWGATAVDVEVIGMTMSGMTVTVRFVNSSDRDRFGVESFRVLRRGEMHDGTGWYLPSLRALRNGEVSFSPSGLAGPQ